MTILWEFDEKHPSKLALMVMQSWETSNSEMDHSRFGPGCTLSPCGTQI